MSEIYSGESVWRRSRVTVAVPAPAAGADWTVKVPGGHLWRPLSILAVLTSSAVVATRAVRLQYFDGVQTFGDWPAFTTQVASLGRRYVFGWGVSGVAIGNAIESYMPDITLQESWQLSSLTDAIDVGDQWTGIFINVIDTWVRRGAISFNEQPDLIVEDTVAGPD